jgi:acetylornithine/succinyldiaminopimelate/putrescine aminotransferase
MMFHMVLYVLLSAHFSIDKEKIEEALLNGDILKFAYEAIEDTDHVKELTPYLEEKLDELVASYDFLTARRGLGLMQGVVSEKPVGQIAAKALEEGLIVITAGSDVLRFVPPLIIEKQHVDEMIGKLKKALDQM